MSLPIDGTYDRPSTVTEQLAWLRALLPQLRGANAIWRSWSAIYRASGSADPCIARSLWGFINRSRAPVCSPITTACHQQSHAQVAARPTGNS